MENHQTDIVQLSKILGPSSNAVSEIVIESGNCIERIFIINEDHIVENVDNSLTYGETDVHQILPDDIKVTNATNNQLLINNKVSASSVLYQMPLNQDKERKKDPASIVLNSAVHKDVETFSIPRYVNDVQPEKLPEMSASEVGLIFELVKAKFLKQKKLIKRLQLRNRRIARRVEALKAFKASLE